MELQDEKAIIERYRNSDMDARLCLFLDNRSLRAEFSAIDLADVKRHLETTTGERPAGFLMNRLWDSAKRILPKISVNRKPSST
jgi:hypothetical protein